MPMDHRMAPPQREFSASSRSSSESNRQNRSELRGMSNPATTSVNSRRISRGYSTGRLAPRAALLITECRSETVRQREENGMSAGFRILGRERKVDREVV